MPTLLQQFITYMMKFEWDNVTNNLKLLTNKKQKCITEWRRDTVKSNSNSLKAWTNNKLENINTSILAKANGWRNCCHRYYKKCWLQYDMDEVMLENLANNQ